MSRVDPLFEPDGEPACLHDALYRVVEEICWDSDYLYRSYTEHFCALMHGIYDAGKGASRGDYRASGIKSGLEAAITWRLQHRIDYQGPNQLMLEVTIRSETPGTTDRGASLLFELGTGRRLAVS